LKKHKCKHLVYQSYFSVYLPSVKLQNRLEKFEQKFRLSAELRRHLSKLTAYIFFSFIAYCLLVTIMYGNFINKVLFS